MKTEGPSTSEAWLLMTLGTECIRIGDTPCWMRGSFFDVKHIRLVTLIFGLFIPGSVDATAKETFCITKELEFSAHDVNHGDWQTPVTTHNGNIYLVWVAENLRTMLAKRTPAGSVTTSVIFAKTDPDKFHNEPSVSVDKNGYVHVVGNMHNSPHRGHRSPLQHAWQYLISNRPDDISSFTFVGGDPDRTIPGTWITYPFFAHDNKGELYVAFRRKVEHSRWDPGDIGVAVAKYDTSTKRWSMLGGTEYKHGVKTLGWSEYGRANTAYQGYKPRVFFDRNNRMHVTWTVYETSASNSEGASFILYAYSDDGGRTFRKANGQTIKLPITQSTGDVAAKSDKRYYNLSHVGVAISGKPIVSFRGDGKNYWARWTGTRWSNPTVMPSAFPARFVTDNNGVITTVGSGKLYRSSDGGLTWRRYTIDTGSPMSTICDYSYLKQTNQLRFQTIKHGKVTVWTVFFSQVLPIVDRNLR